MQNFQTTPQATRAMPAAQATGCARWHALAIAFVLAAAVSPAGAQTSTLRLVTPAPEETVHSNVGTVPVVVTGAMPGALLRVVLDGQALSGSQVAPAFELKGVVRGTHRLVVEVLDEEGKTTGRTPTVRFHVWQASRLNPPR